MKPEDKATITSLVDKRQEPNTHVVELLERWLEYARAGEIRSVFLVGSLQKTGCTRRGSAGEYTIAEVLFQIEQMRWDLMAESMESDQPICSSIDEDD